MPPELIRVQPTSALRREFAVWAVAQRPKVRTVSESVFAVPAAQFTVMPERLLIGSIVDGRRYVSPDEDQAQQLAEGTELLGVGLPGPGSVPLPSPEIAPRRDAPADSSDRSDPDDDNEDEGDGGFGCDVCGRPFKSERGRDAHRRQAHSEA
ncbi:hypothetical protein [Streptomyces misionensis]|uniref:hypothetical protein n=1 Tax=Streptomyces misionensis TaxID=67331 RepID=UPI0033B3FDD4